MPRAALRVGTMGLLAPTDLDIIIGVAGYTPDKHILYKNDGAGAFSLTQKFGHPQL